MNEMSTAGVTVSYFTTKGATHPTTGAIVIPNIKSTPDYNPAPNNLQVTDLSDAEWHRYIPALRDVGGASAFRANLTPEFQTAWKDLCTAAAGEAVWFEIKIPKFDSFYFAGVPTPLGLSGIEVDQVFEVDAYVTPNQIYGFDTAST